MGIFDFIISLGEAVPRVALHKILLICRLIYQRVYGGLVGIRIGDLLILINYIMIILELKLLTELLCQWRSKYP